MKPERIPTKQVIDELEKQYPKAKFSYFAMHTIVAIWDIEKSEMVDELQVPFPYDFINAVRKVA